MSRRRRLEALERRTGRRREDSRRARLDGMTTAEKVARIDQLIDLGRTRAAAAIATGSYDPLVTAETRALHERLERALSTRLDDLEEVY